MRSVIKELLVITALGAVGGCGGDQGSETTTATNAETRTTTAKGQLGIPGRIDIEAPANGDLRLVPDSLTAEAGRLTINFDNLSKTAHGLCLEDEHGKRLFDCSGLVKESNLAGAVRVEPGRYTYYCPVDGHRAAGMEGKLTVE
ncbi:MAG TPA: plastocyanin/azurin family copper-binding protein [Solirubrobacterales bacterium]|nr:plastocyanin/azurin family copper-binding protein [Solirubrobacterales bacterium]